MPKAGKKYTKAAAAREPRQYSLEEAVALLKKIAYAKFNETVEVVVAAGSQSQARGPDGPRAL